MATFVLIPGGWRGGWTFADFVARLRSAGHRAYAITLSGLEDVPVRRTDINLETHIADVIKLLAAEDLSDVILCSHSYAGMVATGVADREPDRIAALAYLDSFAPEDGQSWWDLANEHFRNLVMERVRHDGLSVLPPDGRELRRRPHPLGSFLQALRLTRSHPPIPRVFVYATGWDATPFNAQYQRLRDDPAWTVHTVSCGHDVVNAAPDEIFGILTGMVRDLSLP